VEACDGPVLKTLCDLFPDVDPDFLKVASIISFIQPSFLKVF
jgi:hypothetical protein